MPAIIRMNINELDGLIENIEAKGGNASELREFKSTVLQETKSHHRPRSTALADRDEMTAEERLDSEAGYLFSEGISPKIFDMLIQYDTKYTLEDLKKMCAKAGLSTSGHKKLLAARLIAHERKTA